MATERAKLLKKAPRRLDIATTTNLQTVAWNLRRFAMETSMDKRAGIDASDQNGDEK